MASGLIEGSAADILTVCGEDLLNAVQSRQRIEERKVRDYRLYRRYREDVTGGGQDEDGAGPFGWSKLTAPLIFWTTETILPRLAINMPTFVVTATTTDAMPYAMAKEMRLNRQVERTGGSRQLLLALKQMIVLGDGPMKVGWDRSCRAPRITSIPWWDYWLSAEASDYETAECIFHRTYYTERQLGKLAEATDSEGRALYANLDQVIGASGSHEIDDPTYADRREAAGMGPETFSKQAGVYSLIECWYQDGSLIVLGGSTGDILVSVRTSPHTDTAGKPLRPFAIFRNTPDLFMPYSISDAEMLEDHQDELSIVRNQGIDQMTADINAPIIYSGAEAAEVDAAFGVPGGKLRVQGDVRTSVMRLPPGQMTRDLSEFTEMIRAEAQMVSGINDYAAGQVNAAGISNQTATGIQIIANEANQRWRLKQRFVEDEMTALGNIVNALDRKLGAGALVPVPMNRGYVPRALGPDVKGMSQEGSLSVVTSDADAEGLEYDIEVKAGSAAPPSQREQASLLTAWLGAITSVPQMAMLVDWAQVARQLTEAFGLVPERVLLSDQELAAMSAAQAAPPGPGGEVPLGAPVPADGQPGAVDQAAPAPPGPGETPVGEPQPVSGEVMPAVNGNGMAPMAAPQAPPVIFNVQPGAVQITSPPVNVDTGGTHYHDETVPAPPPQPEVAKRVVYDEMDRPIALVPIEPEPAGPEEVPEEAPGGPEPGGVPGSYPDDLGEEG